MNGTAADPTHVSVPGFEGVRVSGALLVARPAAMPWAREALRQYRSLHAAGLSNATLTLAGRGPIPVYNPPGHSSPWAIRRYRRGGGLRFMGDRFVRLGCPRSLRELEASARVRALGIQTPTVMAAAVYPEGPFYRADIVTEYIDDARELADLLLGTADLVVPAAADVRVQALQATSQLVAHMAERGVVHPDLNARNILLRQTSQGMEAILLDLDRCAISDRPEANTGFRLRRRLARSILKLQSSRPRELSDEEMAVILRPDRRSHG